MIRNHLDLTCGCAPQADSFTEQYGENPEAIWSRVEQHIFTVQAQANEKNLPTTHVGYEYYFWDATSEEDEILELNIEPGQRGKKRTEKY